MFNWASALTLSLVLLAMLSTVTASTLPQGAESIGRLASDAEIAAWDIDVRPDFLGLPQGSGDVWQGEEIWLAQCASCHGDFGDANHIFAPIVLGNITEEDIAQGRVAALQNPAITRTTLMKVPTLSTLWDYIYRAMPWNAPKSLTSDEVYALLAYILNLGYVVEDDFVLSDANIRVVQQRMPNRNGMTRDNGLWSVSDPPDVMGHTCVSDCAAETGVTSSLPDYAMNAHGNLAEQSRSWGPYPGQWTAPPLAQNEPQRPTVLSVPAQQLTTAGCTACHQMTGPLIGPSFHDIRDRYKGSQHAAYLQNRITQGGGGVWGDLPMPAMPDVGADALQDIIAWLIAGEWEEKEKEG